MSRFRDNVPGRYLSADVHDAAMFCHAPTIGKVRRRDAAQNFRTDGYRAGVHDFGVATGRSLPPTLSTVQALETHPDTRDDGSAGTRKFRDQHNKVTFRVSDDRSSSGRFTPMIVVRVQRQIINCRKSFTFIVGEKIVHIFENRTF